MASGSYNMVLSDFPPIVVFRLPAKAGVFGINSARSRSREYMYLYEALPNPPPPIVRVERQLGYSIPQRPGNFVERVECSLSYSTTANQKRVETSRRYDSRAETRNSGRVEGRGRGGGQSVTLVGT